MFSSFSPDIICAIGPTIRKCHFEVDVDVQELFYNEFSYLYNIDDIITKKDSKYYIDSNFSIFSGSLIPSDGAHIPIVSPIFKFSG